MLSNNDGCIISRSAEAKAAGFLMGEPYFKCKDKLLQHQAIVCSSNFTLYGDFSDRIISILEENLPQVEQYSIDEAFAQVGDETVQNWEEVGIKLRKRIRRWTGITVSVGLAPSKTLAKLANETAKKNPQYQQAGMLALRSEEDWQPLLRRTPVGDIWGVGKKLNIRMKALGLITAADLAACSLDRLRQNFGVQGERIALELRGIDCLKDNTPSTRGQIMVSRSLKNGVQDKEQLRGVLARFAEKAARNMRREDLLCRQVHIVLRSSLFEQSDRLYSGSLGITLPHPSDDTREITAAATSMLDRIFQQGFDYKKIGILLTELTPRDELHPSFDRPCTAPSPLMTALDELQKAGHNIHFGSHGTEELWQKSFTSPLYTTDWSQIPEVK